MTTIHTKRRAPAASMTETFPSSALPKRQSGLDGLHQQSLEADKRLNEAHGPWLESLRTAVHDHFHKALARLRHKVADATHEHRECLDVIDLAGAYADRWLWKFSDIPLWALALQPPGRDPGRLCRRVASCGMVLLTIRAVGDLLDRHFHPRGDASTPLVGMEQGDGIEHRRDGEAIDSGRLLLAALLLSFEGVEGLVDFDAVDSDGVGSDGEDALALLALRRLMAAGRRSVLARLLEQASSAPGAAFPTDDPEDWRCLYAAVDPHLSSPLYPFLERFHDLARRLPGGSAGRSVGALRGQHLEDELLALGRVAQELPTSEQAIALCRLGDLIERARRLELPACRPPAGEENPADEPLLASFIDLSTVVDRFGPEGVEQTPCPVCGEIEHSKILEKQGFPLVRCPQCRHLYVTPRLRSQLQGRIDDPGDETFLDAQRVYAGYICRLLSEHAPGQRLLDIGFGQGHLLQGARAFGFEAYGVERSVAAIAALEPEFGRRLHHSTDIDEPLPWGHFDVVVMSHVLEHSPDPKSTLHKVRRACRADSLIYIAVPDMDSLQFRIFGKEWEVVSPVVHYQYFTQKSLTELLERCGFVVEGRVELPALPAELRPPRWMELFRRLGGSDSGELAMLARVAPQEAEDS